MTTYDSKKASRWVDHQIKSLTDYVREEDATGFPELNRQGLRAYAAGTANIGEATVSLQYLAGYTSVLGCRNVLRGDASGFREIDLACLYNYWMIRLLVRGYDQDTRAGKQPRIYMETVATCWTHARALDAHEIVDWLSERVRKVDAGDPSIGGKDMNPLCTLTAHFATGREPKALEASGWSSIGVYRPAADRTLDVEQYDQLADYHTRRIGGDDFPEFSFYPYIVVPFELLAIERITGVPIGGASHPLLKTPWVRQREVPEIPLTDELSGVIERARSELGGL